MTVIKKGFILLCMLIYPFLLAAQDTPFSKKYFKNKKKELKIAQQNIDQGDIFWEKGVVETLLFRDAVTIFENALFYYEKANNFNPNSSVLNYKIGTSLLYTNRKEFAFSYLEKALSLSDKLPSNSLFYYAMTLQLKERYVEAIDYYEKFINDTKKKDYIIRRFKCISL